jgi:hypothetical protein
MVLAHRGELLYQSRGEPASFAGIAAVWLTDQTFSDTLKNDAATRKGHSKVLRVGVILTILAFTFGQTLVLCEVGFA